MFNQAEIQKYNPKSEIKDCPADKLELRDQVHRYALSAVKLYDLITLSDFIALFESYTQITLSPTDLYDLLLPLVYEEESYFFYQDYLVDRILCFNLAEIAEIHKLHQYIEPYIPESAEEFLDYGSMNHFKKISPVFLDWIKQYEMEEEKAFEGLTSQQIDLIKQALKELLDTFQVENIEDLKLKIQNLLMDQILDVPLGRLHGHKYQDLSAILQEMINEMKQGSVYDMDQAFIQTENKMLKLNIGRNEPCPCQSGRKYKKCCGRYLNSPTACLDPSEFEEFIELWHALLDYVIEKENYDLDFCQEWEWDGEDDVTFHIGSNLHLRDHPFYLIEYALDGAKNEADKQLLKTWYRHLLVGHFVIFRYEADGALLGRLAGATLEVFKVQGLNKPLGAMLKATPGQVIETALLPFKGKIIIDGLVEATNYQFKASFYDQLFEDFRAVEDRGEIIEDLTTWKIHQYKGQAEDLVRILGEELERAKSV